MFSNVVVLCVVCTVCRAVCDSHKLHGTQYTVQLGKSDKSICLHPICIPKVQILNFSECTKAHCHNTEKLIAMYFTD
jgi:hypothetical protein